MEVRGYGLYCTSPGTSPGVLMGARYGINVCEFESEYEYRWCLLAISAEVEAVAVRRASRLLGWDVD